jgi:hypothetical protein
MVEEGFYYTAGQLRNTSVTIGGTTWKPDLPIESVIKEELEELEKNPDIIEPQLKECPVCKYFNGKKCTNHWQMEYMDKESFEKRIADASDCYGFEEIDEEVENL